MEKYIIKTKTNKRKDQEIQYVREYKQHMINIHIYTNSIKNAQEYKNIKEAKNDMKHFEWLTGEKLEVILKNDKQ